MRYGSNKQTRREIFYRENRKSRLLFLNKGFIAHWCDLCKCLHFIDHASSYKKNTEEEIRFDFNHTKPTFTGTMTHKHSDGKVCQYSIIEGNVLFKRNDRTGRDNAEVALLSIPDRQIKGF